MECLLVLLALLAGISVAIQPLLNATASATLGHPLWGAVASAAITFLVLVAVVLALRLPVPIGRMVWPPPIWFYGGGLIGALMLFAGLFVAPKLGIATTVALFIGGQLAAALVIDHFGWLGVPRHLVSMPRVLGAGCLLAGVLLVRTS